MSKAIFYAMTVMLLVVAISACSKDNNKKEIVLEGPAVSVQPMPRNGKAMIRIAVGGMVTPKDGIAYYRDLLRYVQKKLGERVQYVDREDYAAINDMLKTGKLQAAFVCSGPYVDGKRDFGLQLLVAPQVHGETVYYSYIIVAKNSPYRTLADLRGKKFAFTDPLSNTGTLVPTYMLAQMGETPKTFFGKVIYTKSHDTSIKAVAEGIVDGAAVDSLIWNYLNATNPKFTSRTRIIKKSPPYAIPPVVVPRNLAPALKAKLKKIFLHANLDPEGKAILKKMGIDKFVVIDDKAYDSVRAMQNWIAAQKSRQ